jgi:hypothetical protein
LSLLLLLPGFVEQAIWQLEIRNTRTGCSRAEMPVSYSEGLVTSAQLSPRNLLGPCSTVH